MKKNMIRLLLLAMLFATTVTTAQTPAASANTSAVGPYWQFAPRVGYDIPTYNNNTPYIDYKGGIEVGLSVDHYWSWFGLGADIDHIKNRPKSTYPTNNLVNAASVNLTSFSILEKPITRMFFGIGPSFKYEKPTGNLSLELNTRVGLGSIKGGRTELRETNTLLNELLNFHAGYSTTGLAAKAQVRANYLFNNGWGIHIGAYYLRHFNTTELFDPALGVSARYQGIKADSAGNNNFDGTPYKRIEPCHCDVSSIGVFAGITFKLPKGKAKKERYSLTVTAKDKYTGALLPETMVQVKDNVGVLVRTGKTNSAGVVVFENMVPDNYTVSGTLNDIALEGATVLKTEFATNRTVHKTILYGDRNFIIKGRIFACNTSTPIPSISVILENNDQAFKKTTVTDAEGNFTLQLPEMGHYVLYGKKGDYFSQIEEITASNYSRDKNLFVKLEMCAEPVECGKAINLKNILFDLDKYLIREDAKPELNKLVRFMKDNPTVRVEVGSHTDCRASAEYNQVLSQNRANASVDYVVSQGITRNRITGKGYGETRLLNECADGVKCTEAQHAINRRTEMKVICNGN